MKFNFDAHFETLTGSPPFPWQRALFERFLEDREDNIPASCNLPTGLGKTSVVAIWLLALIHQPQKMPRRLVYVVNRRTVVDQTTTEVQRLRDNLEKVARALPKLAISTLRGQFADNREWSADPSRPAVIVGTVDMIGSRLLFSGYGVGFKGRPLHAGFLGQDALLVHDEAHLEPAFQKLLMSIEAEQRRERENQPNLPWFNLKVMELTATSRGSVTSFGLTAEDQRHPTVQSRIAASKTIHLDAIKDAKKLAEQLSAKALAFKDRKRAVLVFARTVEDVIKVRDKLPEGRVLTLTGTMRGKERDELVGKSLFQRFMPGGQSDDQTTYLICTSAGEVGVNISADHLVCDLSTFESMAQRFGRVNRFGLRNDSEIHVLHPQNADFAEEDYDRRRQLTLALLRSLDRDASPAALGRLDPEACQAAFAPTPAMLPATEILFDAWALTSIRDKLPGRPPVEPYLHGLPTDWQPPETHVAWREEVEFFQQRYPSEAEQADREFHDRRALAKLVPELLEDFPLKPHELLRDTMTRVRSTIDKLAATHPDAPAWVVSDSDEVTITTLRELTETQKRDGRTVYKIDSRHATILLPPSVGGLNAQGMLDPQSTTADDISCVLFDDAEKTKPFRARSMNDTPPDGMRLVRRLERPSDGSEGAEPVFWYWFARLGDDDASKSAREPIRWQHHTDDVKRNLTEFARKLFPNDTAYQRTLELAAAWHDLGKKRIVWQRSIGNPNPTEWFAKSGKDPRTGQLWKPLDITEYRHEFGSLLDLCDEGQAYRTEFELLTEDQCDLVLHLIAAHHGRARPHFARAEAFDPEHADEAAERIAAETPRRFAQLQRRYGRWGLAYLESLLRAADWAASAEPSKITEETE